MSTKWPADWDGRFQVIDATIRMTTFNPVVAWQPTGKVAVAGGIHYSDVKLAERSALNLATLVPGAPEGTVSLNGDARASGFYRRPAREVIPEVAVRGELSESC